MDDQKVMPTKNNIEGQMLVIFGSNGDLARRKLLPSLFQLHAINFYPKILHYWDRESRKEQSVFRQELRKV
jgi:glucose-6-phosphate 1-dehydrogenase